MQGMGKAYIIIRAGPGDREALQEAKRLSGRTYSAIVREAVRLYLTNLKKGRR